MRKIIKKLLVWRYVYLAILAMIMAIATSFWFAQHPPKVLHNHTQPDAPNKSLNNSWQPVSIGGGGYVTGIYTHPTGADLVYIRTDNGGYYRWQTKAKQWIPITDSLPRGFWDYDHNSGGEDLALDPQNPDLVYIAVGKYSDQPGTIYKSVDRGKTWQQSNLAVAMGGNEDLRWAGNRLAVSPFKSNLLLFGSRQDGLWRSLDGGLNWTQVSGLATAVKNEIGILAIAFDPQQQNLVYASIYDDGVYQSQDQGETWKRLADSPTQVMKLAVAQDGLVYATNNKFPQVSKYEQGKWQNISPKGIIHSSFNGLSLHPQEPGTLIVSEGDKGKARIFYSSDRGRSWTKKTATINKTVPWLAAEFFNDHPSAIAFDAQNPQKVWLADWFSVWRTDNINSKTVTWTNKVAGIEQTVAFTLISPPKGAILISGIADQDGFYHQQLNTYPNSRLGFQGSVNRFSALNLTGDDYIDNYFQDTFHIAYCPTKPQHLVRVGGQRWRETYMGATSQDGGVTWQPWVNIPKNKLFMRVAISANDPQHFLVTTSEDQPLLTNDGGTSWQNVSGLPNGEAGPWNWNQPLAADGANPEQFYYYAAGQVYRSIDGGLTFQTVPQEFPLAERYILTTVPGVVGEIWLSLDQGGLYHSQDGGVSFIQIKAVKEAHLVTVGKPFKDNFSHSIYVYGKLHNGQSGLFLSQDQGENWVQINQMSQIPRTTKVLVASQQQPGLIFAGTDGRGIQYQLLTPAKVSQ